MQPGRKLVIPPKPERAAAEPAVVPARPADGIVGNGPGYRLYLVEKGDTLSGLAERFYQSSATDKQALIEDANPHLKYGYLRAGERIKIMDPRR
jgi:LysM repeat protein